MEINVLYKKKKCADKDCANEFFPYKSTDKYCCYGCAAKNTKPLKRTPIKKTALKRKPSRIKKKSKKAVAFEHEFRQARTRVKARVEKKHGKLCCERCATTESIQFSTHHIIYRSERPSHPMMNDERNLIYLCFDCHEWFHSRKKNRNYLVSERHLLELFDNIWGYEPDI